MKTKLEHGTTPAPGDCVTGSPRDGRKSVP